MQIYSVLAAWIALFLTLCQISYFLYKRRLNYQFKILVFSFSEQGIVWKVSIVNNSAKQLIIKRMLLRYEGTNSLFFYEASSFNKIITENVKSKTLPITLNPYSSNSFYVVMEQTNDFTYTHAFDLTGFRLFLSTNQNNLTEVQISLADIFQPLAILKQRELEELRSKKTSA